MRNKSRCPSVIILLTQLVCADVLMKAELLGVSVLLRKPYEMATIRNHLSQTLKEKNPSRISGRGMESQEDTPVWTTQKSTS